MICRFVILDGVDGAPYFGDSRGGTGELGSRRCHEAWRGFLIGGIPWKARKHWLEGGAGRGNRTLN